MGRLQLHNITFEAPLSFAGMNGFQNPPVTINTVVVTGGTKDYAEMDVCSHTFVHI